MLPLKTLVVTPTYNEAVNIGNALDGMLAASPSVHVLVVDDNSPDGTAECVRNHPEFNARVFLLQRAGKGGYAGACKEGLRWGLERDYDAFATLDADGSHNPSDLPRLMAEVKGGADLAVGSRYLGGIRIINWPLSRLLLSSFAGIYIRTLTGLPMTDPTSGFKVISRGLLERSDLHRCSAEGYGFIVEFHFHTWRGGGRIVEIPIIFTERAQGVSKMSRRIIFESAWMVWKLMFQRIGFTRPKKLSCA